MSSDSIMKPDTINYKSVPMHNGRYRLRRVPLSNITGSSVTLEPTSTQLVEWRVPANQVFNPGRSSIDYNILLADPGANVANWNFEDTFEICSSIQFCNAQGVYLTDLQYANMYVNAVRKVDISKADFESSDVTSGLYKANDAATNWFPPLVSVPANNAYRLPVNAALNHASTLIEPQYAKPGALNTATLITRSIPLSCFTETALGMDRDMIFAEDMYIRMMIASSSKVGYTSTSATDPVAGAAVFATQPVISNLYLNLATQVDEVVEASVKDKFLRGDMTFQFPSVYGWRSTTNSGTASIQLQINNGFGKLLKRLIHVPVASGETLNTAYDHENLNGSKIRSYQTFLDSKPLQDSVLSCRQPVSGGAHGMDDWRENRELLRGSALEGSLAYYYNWVHIDSFSQPKRDKVLVPTDNIYEGLDLTMPVQWTITADTAVNLTNYTFGTFVRQVAALPTGTQILTV